jgi:tRNA(fMet)-specific endonuclease VapC
MTTYLLDRNACIALINGAEINVRRRFQRAVARESVILLSSIVAFELWYGVAKSQRKESNAQRLETFFAGPLEWTLFDEDDARSAGSMRAALEAMGKPVGAYDLLLAGQARRRGATLVTSNTREFARVPGLKWEDWAVARRPSSPGPRRTG